MKVLRLQTFKQPQTVWMQQLIARTDMPSKLITGHETDSKNKTVCQQWALAITVSFATSCPHSLRVSQLYPLALLILQTAEFHFQEKKKKNLQWLSAELRDEALRHEREWVEKKKMEHDQITWSGPGTQERLRPGDSHRNRRGTLTWM